MSFFVQNLLSWFLSLFDEVCKKQPAATEIHRNPKKKDGPLLWTTVQMHPTYGVGGVHSSISGGVQCVLGFKNWFYSSIIIFIRIEDVYVGLPR